MKTQLPIEAPVKNCGKPWKTVKGECREVPIYRWISGERTFYRVLIPGATPPHKTTSNEQTILNLAATLAGVPKSLGPSISSIKPELLEKTAEAIKRLETVLSPLGVSIDAGVEEYAQLKARTGKVILPDLFNGLLTAGDISQHGTALEDRLRDISAAIAKLVPVLGPLHISIASGIEEYAVVKAKAGSQDLRELLKQVLEKPWIQKSKTPAVLVLEEFLISKKEDSAVSSEYYKTLYYTLNYIVERLEKGVSIGGITTDELRPLVFRSNLAKRSQKTYRTNICTFMRWCQLNQYLDYSQPTAADRLPTIKLPEPAPRILTVEEAKALLTAMDDPWCLLFLVLSLFTGIRHDELQEVTFDLIKPGLVLDITAEISKTGKRRLPPIQPVLDAWLAPFYGRSGLVLPIREIQAKVLKFMRENGFSGLPTDWSRNWLRQSYSSYRLAQTGKVVLTAAEDGHRPYILETVYLHLTTEETANAYFSLTPEACGKTDWYENTKAFLKDMPEVHVRRRNKRKPWKKIGGEPAPGIPLSAQPSAVVLPETAPASLQVGIQQAA